MSKSALEGALSCLLASILRIVFRGMSRITLFMLVGWSIDGIAEELGTTLRLPTVVMLHSMPSYDVPKSTVGRAE